MASLIGFYSLIFGLFSSSVIIFLSILNFRNTNSFDKKILTFTFLQLFFVIVSFLGLIFSFINSDFSNQTVYNHSHTTKPIFYKISGTWGNHEGSLLLWLLVLTLFIFVFLIKSKEQSKQYRILTLLFQQVIIIGFFIFLIKTSNPFNYIFPVPKEGLGLNPIFTRSSFSNSSSNFIFRVCRIINYFFINTCGYFIKLYFEKMGSTY